MITEEAGELIYEEPTSDYVPRKYFNMAFIIFAIFILILFNFVGISSNFFSGEIVMYAFGNLLLVFTCLYTYLHEMRKIHSNRLQIFQNGIVPPTIYKKNKGFLPYEEIQYILTVKMVIREKEYCNRIEIYLRRDEEIDRDITKSENLEELKIFLEELEKIVIVAWDISKDSFNELVNAFEKNELINRETAAGLRHPLCSREDNR